MTTLLLLALLPSAADDRESLTKEWREHDKVLSALRFDYTMTSHNAEGKLIAFDSGVVRRKGNACRVLTRRMPVGDSTSRPHFNEFWTDGKEWRSIWRSHADEYPKQIVVLKSQPDCFRAFANPLLPVSMAEDVGPHVQSPPPFEQLFSSSESTWSRSDDRIIVTVPWIRGGKGREEFHFQKESPHSLVHWERHAELPRATGKVWFDVTEFVEWSGRRLPKTVVRRFVFKGPPDFDETTKIEYSGHAVEDDLKLDELMAFEKNPAIKFTNEKTGEQRSPPPRAVDRMMKLEGAKRVEQGDQPPPVEQKNEPPGPNPGGSRD